MMSDLPTHVYAVKDRHGKVRYRFRRKGWKQPYLPGAPGDAEFHRAYAEILDAGPSQPAGAKALQTIRDKSLDDLYRRVKASPRWKRKGDRTRHVQGRILDRFMGTISKSGNRYGDRPVANVTVGWLDTIFGAMSDTPAAANVLRKILSGLMDHAIRLGWRADNPVKLTECYKEGDGHHTWTDDEIEQYRTAHPLGTMARLTLELALNTAARRCNIAWITRDDIKGGRIAVAHVKGNNETSVRIMPTTQAALDALPAAPIRHLIVTQFGKPFTEAGLGNRMRKWCDDAGLEHCSMHGLRKAVSRQLAERGATDAQGQAVTGHKKAETFAAYRAKANRTTLADQASNLLSGESFQPSGTDENEGKASA